MGQILVGNKNNIFTSSFNASAKTLSISNNTVYDLQFFDLLSVYDVTTASAFNFAGMTPDNGFAVTKDSNGLPVYTWTFQIVPVGSTNGDTLIIMISCPDQFLQYTAQLYANGATI